jgi:hypothetical protein
VHASFLVIAGKGAESVFLITQLSRNVGWKRGFKHFVEESKRLAFNDVIGWDGPWAFHLHIDAEATRQVRADGLKPVEVFDSVHSLTEFLS